MRLKGAIPVPGLKSSKSNVSKSSKKSQKGRKLLEPVYELQANTKSAFVEDDDESSEKYHYKSAVSNYSRKVKSNRKSFDEYHNEHRMSYTDCESENTYGDGFSLKFVASEVASTTTMPESLVSQPITDRDDFQDPGHSIEYETDDLLQNFVDGKSPKMQLMAMTNENIPNDENCGASKWCSPLNILQMQSTMTTKTSYYSDVSENKHTQEKEDKTEKNRQEDRCPKLNEVENKDPSAPPSFYGTWLDIKSKLSVVSSMTANSVDGNDTTLKSHGAKQEYKDVVNKNEEYTNNNSFDNTKDDESFEETLRVRFNNFVRLIGQNCSDEMKPIATNQDETWPGETPTPRHRNVSKVYGNVSQNVDKIDVIDYNDEEVQQTPLDVLDFLDSSLNSVSSEQSKSKSQELKPYIHHVDENDTETKRGVSSTSPRSRRGKNDRNLVTRARSPSRRNGRSTEPLHIDTKSLCSKSIESSPSQSRRNKSTSLGITTSRSRSPARRLKASKVSNETENMKSPEKKKSNFRSRLGRSRSPSRKIANTTSGKKQGAENQSLGSRSNRSGRSRSPSRKISNSALGRNVGTESQSLGSRSNRSVRSRGTSRKISNATGVKSQGTEIQSVGSKSNRSGRSRSPSRKVSSSMSGNHGAETHVNSKGSRSGRSRSPSRKMSQGMPRAGRSPSRRSQK